MSRRSKKKSPATADATTISELDLQENFLEAGIESLRAAGDCLRGQPSAREMRWAVREVSTGAELITKSILASEHWTLVLDQREEPNLKRMRSGDAMTAPFHVCLDRLEAVLELPFPKDARPRLDDLRRLRNQAEHLGLAHNVESVSSVVGGALQELMTLLEAAKDADRLVAGYEEAHSELAKHLAHFGAFVTERWAVIKTDLHAQRVDLGGFVECPQCRQRACSFEGGLSCHFCGDHTEPREAAEFFCTVAIGVTGYDARDGEHWPIHECPECQRDSMVMSRRLGNPFLRCFGCGEEWNHDNINECSECGHFFRRLDEDDDYNVCFDCFHEKVSGDD